MTMRSRIILTILVLAGSALARTLAFPISMMGAARSAGLQLSNSDQSAFVGFTGMRAYEAIVPAIVLLTFLCFLAIWWRPIRQGFRAVRKEQLSALLVAGTSLMFTSPASAYWSTTNVTEAYGIMPNHSAFWIPGTGDTKDNQARTESEEFYKENKVSGKFFPIPHVKLQGSVYMGWDYYIPAGRLIVVDRAPYFHEWTKKGRGTDGNLDQSFPCHSKDNIQVSTEMSLASSVVEDDAAKFLFYFGVNPLAGDPSKPEVIFTSVFEGRSLAQVMNGWGRGEIQSRVCRHVNAYTIEELALHGNEILDQIQTEARQFFRTFGITIEYIGWAGGFEYPPEVQNAINTRFAADHISPVIATLGEKAKIDAISGWAKSPQLPQTLLMFGGLSDLVTQLVGGVKK